LTNILVRDLRVTSGEYAKQLRPLLPAQAFLPNPNKILILGINLAILVLGWGTASYLDRWSWSLLWLFLPLSLIMGNSIIVLLFCSHDIMHSKTIKNLYLRQIVSLLGLSMLWMPPTLWVAVHNRKHHQNTNAQQDPDRSYLYSQPNTWGKWIQDRFVPSSEVTKLGLFIGMGHAWGVHIFRNLSAILLFNNGKSEYQVASFKVTTKERQAIALELIVILSIHLTIISALGFHPVKLILSYFLPIWIGFAGVMFYIYTNHLLCPMMENNDPLLNTLSVRVPPFFDCLHLNFSYHTEHHIFPSLNSDYYPLVQTLLQEYYPDRFNLLNIGEAWHLLLNTPRYYKDENTLTHWAGNQSIPCPLAIAVPTKVK
jgi:fatty acid desaturase